MTDDILFNDKVFIPLPCYNNRNSTMSADLIDYLSDDEAKEMFEERA